MTAILIELTRESEDRLKKRDWTFRVVMDDVTDRITITVDDVEESSRVSERHGWHRDRLRFNMDSLTEPPPHDKDAYKDAVRALLASVDFVDEKGEVTMTGFNAASLVQDWECDH